MHSGNSNARRKPYGTQISDEFRTQHIVSMCIGYSEFTSN